MRGPLLACTETFPKYSGYDSPLLLKKWVNLSPEKGFKLKEKLIIAKLSEIYIAVKIGFCKHLGSYRLMDSSSNKLSTTSKFFPSLDANGMKYELFRKNLSKWKRFLIHSINHQIRKWSWFSNYKNNPIQISKKY